MEEKLLNVAKEKALTYFISHLMVAENWRTGRRRQV